MRSSGDASAGKGLETSNMMEGKRVREMREKYCGFSWEEEGRRKVECAAGGSGPFAVANRNKTPIFFSYRMHTVLCT